MPDGSFHVTLTVVSATDGKILYPFGGAAVIGPFSTIEEAREAARARGEQIALAEMQSPE